MVVLVMIFATFALLTAATLTLGAAAWLTKGLLRLLIVAGVAVIWLGYFLCFPRQAAFDWQALREPTRA